MLLILILWNFSGTLCAGNAVRNRKNNHFTCLNSCLHEGIWFTTSYRWTQIYLFLHQQYPNVVTKLIYCSRTVPEIEKVVEELKRLVKYIEEETKTPTNLLGLCLSSRKNMCINENVSPQNRLVSSWIFWIWFFQVLKAVEGKAIDGKCHTLTASFVREKHKSDPSVPVCDLFEVWAHSTLHC